MKKSILFSALKKYEWSGIGLGTYQVWPRLSKEPWPTSHKINWVAQQTWANEASLVKEVDPSALRCGEPLLLSGSKDLSFRPPPPDCPLRSVCDFTLTL